MSIIQGNAHTSAGGGYQIERSLRFNSADSAYLNRTPASAGNRKTWTWSGWIKRSGLGIQVIFGVGNVNTGSTFGGLYFDTDDSLVFYSPTSGGYKDTTQVFRDVGAWYHIVCGYDTPNSIVKLYVNGTEITAFSTNTNPSANVDGNVNAAVSHTIGRNASTSEYYLNGYMTEVNFIDGQALTPSSFGETDSNTGVWKPKAFSGTYGTNGFYLKFADNSGTTSTTLGKDSSGNGNNWTPNNFSVTAGAGNDSLVDSPTSYGTDTGVGGEVRGNYATLNPLISTATLSNGNLDFSQTNTKTAASVGVTSGKWYSEATCNTTANRLFGVGVVKVGDNSAFNLFVSGVIYYADDGSKYVDGTNSAYGATYTAGDIIGIALNMDAGTVTFYKNNTSQGSISLPTSSQGYYPLAIQAASGSTSATWTTNFGQRPFAYTAPSGFKALCTQNLPTPTIGATSTTQANDYFNVGLWTSNSSASNIAVTGIGFQPDFFWGKLRSAATSHRLIDSIRGVTKTLYSNATNAEGTESDAFASFNADGFTIGQDTTGGGLNYLTNTGVGWVWKGGGTGVTNTAGTITSTVSANTTGGFSIVTYTGTGSNATVGHGLGVAPAMYIVKRRTGGIGNWAVWHTSLSNTTTSYILLDSTAAQSTSTSLWGSTAATSTTLGLGTSVTTNNSSDTYVAYCFAPVAGYSAFGSYTGNLSTDGPFVYTGFRPAFVLLKNVNTVGIWYIWDNKRIIQSNGDAGVLQPQVADAEADYNASGIDLLSNGFKIRNADNSDNKSGDTIIYAAFAESPFKYALAR